MKDATQRTNSSNHSQLGEVMSNKIRLICNSAHFSEMLHTKLQDYGLGAIR
jgi:hypothetical protein